MPDYSKGIIYTIRSKDSIYVGSTVNFTSRKNQHKCNIYNKNNKKYNFKIYKTIRENNYEWDMQPYSQFSCNSKIEQRVEEERIRQLLKAELNMISCGTGLTKKEYAKSTKIINYKKEWYSENKNYCSEKNKKYREQHKDELQKHYNEQIKCECGCFSKRSNLARHKRSKKHLKFMEAI